MKRWKITQNRKLINEAFDQWSNRAVASAGPDKHVEKFLMVEKFRAEVMAFLDEIPVDRPGPEAKAGAGAQTVET